MMIWGKMNVLTASDEQYFAGELRHVALEVEIQLHHLGCS